MINYIRHIGLNVKDLDKSIAFYRKLGFEVISRKTESWGEKVLDVVKLRARHGPLTLLELVQGDWFNHFAVQVKSIDEMKIVTGMRKDGVAFIYDPDGHYVELVEGI